MAPTDEALYNANVALREKKEKIARECAVNYEKVHLIEQMIRPRLQALSAKIISGEEPLTAMEKKEHGLLDRLDVVVDLKLDTCQGRQQLFAHAGIHGAPVSDGIKALVHEWTRQVYRERQIERLLGPRDQQVFVHDPDFHCCEYGPIVTPMQDAIQKHREEVTSMQRWITEQRRDYNMIRDLAAEGNPAAVAQMPTLATIPGILEQANKEAFEMSARGEAWFHEQPKYEFDAGGRVHLGLAGNIDGEIFEPDGWSRAVAKQLGLKGETHAREAAPSEEDLEKFKTGLRGLPNLF